MTSPTTGPSPCPFTCPRPGTLGRSGTPAGSRALLGLLALGLALAPARLAALPQEPGARSSAAAAAEATSPAAAPVALTAEDYARAERFLSWNVEPLVYRADVNPNWMQGDRFWYRTRIPEGHEFIVVDPESGTRAQAFDHDPARYPTTSRMALPEATSAAGSGSPSTRSGPGARRSGPRHPTPASDEPRAGGRDPECPGTRTHPWRAPLAFAYLAAPLHRPRTLHPCVTPGRDQPLLCHGR